MICILFSKWFYRWFNPLFLCLCFFLLGYLDWSGSFPLWSTYLLVASISFGCHSVEVAFMPSLYVRKASKCFRPLCIGFPVNISWFCWICVLLKTCLWICPALALCFFFNNLFFLLLVPCSFVTRCFRFSKIVAGNIFASFYFQKRGLAYFGII